MKEFNVILYTASTRRYAEAINEVLGIEKLPILARENCSKIDKIFLKDLRNLIGLDLDKCLIVDNMITSFCLSRDIGIPIKSFVEDKEDRELEFLLEKLLNFNRKKYEKSKVFVEVEFGLREFYAFLESKIVKNVPNRRSASISTIRYT